MEHSPAARVKLGALRRFPGGGSGVCDAPIEKRNELPIRFVDAPLRQDDVAEWCRRDVEDDKGLLSGSTMITRQPSSSLARQQSPSTSKPAMVRLPLATAATFGLSGLIECRPRLNPFQGFTCDPPQSGDGIGC
jgi:hypothetical protein